MDAVASESQFLDHLAPVWTSLPVRGTFYVERSLLERAQRKGIAAQPIDAQAIRESMGQQPPRFDGPPAFVASIGDLKVARRMGYGPFAFLEHGAGQTYGDLADPAHSSYSGGPDHDDCELFLAPSEAVAGRWRERYPRSRSVVVGCPKLDTLPRQEKTRPVVAIAFHWPAPMSVGWGYAGTCAPEYMAILPALRDRFELIGHQHPNWLQRKYSGPPSREYAKLGIPFVEDFEAVCRQAAVYVCDNSSTIFEFAATGRPVVLLNSRHWSRKVDYGLRFWEAAHVGLNVNDPSQLVAAIELSLLRADMLSWTPAGAAESLWDREDALSRVYQPRSGGAALAAAAITEWLASRERVAVSA